MDHTLALVRVAAGADELRQHRCLSLLGLQEERIGPVTAEHQQDPRSRADTAHPDDLAGRVDHPEVLEEVAAIGLERAPVSAQHDSQKLHDLVEIHPRGDVLDRLDERRVADDATLAVDDVGQLVECLRAVAGASLGHVRVGSLAGNGVHPLAQLLHHRLDVDVGVPHRQVGHLGELAHRRPIRAQDAQEHLLAILGRIAVLAPGDGEAGREPLDVPLPRPGKGLVEVVDVEDQPALRRGERTEVHQVRVATHLCREP